MAKTRGIFLSILILSLTSSSEVFACTIFYFVHDGKMYFCNNEDWSDPDTEIRFHPARKGQYAWVYLGFSNDWAQGGVNEKGLCWDWVAGRRVDDWKADPSKLNYRGNLCEEMVKRCASVEEAITFLGKYNEESFSYARLMIADKHGNSAILGWENGGLHIARNTGSLQAFGYRGHVIEECVFPGGGESHLKILTTALDRAHQEGQYPTRYSNIISLSEGRIYLYRDHNYEEYLEIDYPGCLTKKKARYKIKELFEHPARVEGISLRI